MPMRRLLFTRPAVCLRNHDECRPIRFSNHKSPRGTILFRTPVGKRKRTGSAIFGTELYRISLREPRCRRSRQARPCDVPGEKQQRLSRAGDGGKRAPGPRHRDTLTVRDRDAAFRRSRDTFLKRGHTTDIAASNMHSHQPVPGCWRSRLRSSRRQRDHPAPQRRSHSSDARAIHRVGGLCGHANVDTAPAALECPA